MPKEKDDGIVVSLISVPNTEIPPGTFVDIRPPEGLAYLITIGVISGNFGGTFVSIVDSVAGLDIFNAPAGGNNASGTVLANHQSWIRINNVDQSTSSVYIATGVALKVG